MTREQRRMVDKLWAVYHQHRGAHDCAEVEIPDAAILGRFMGPVCAEEDRLLRFITDLEFELNHAPVHCAICGEAMEPTDRLPYVLREAHFACASAEQLARTGAARVGVAVGQRMGGGRVLALVGKGAGR